MGHYFGKDYCNAKKDDKYDKCDKHDKYDKYDKYDKCDKHDKYDKCDKHDRYDKYEEEGYKVEKHNHEFESSTDYKKDDERVIHNHRIAGVTGPAIKCGKSHVHKVREFIDTFDDHYHEICVVTGPAIKLPGGKHIHIIMGKTTCNDGHRHDFYFTTLIEDPTEVPEDIDC